MKRERPAPNARRSYVTFVIGAIFIALTLVTATIGAIRQRGEPVRVPDWERVAAGGTHLDARIFPVTMTFFTDYQCPYCAVAWDRVRTIARQRPGQVGIVIRHLPLARHPRAMPAALAAVCASRNGVLGAFTDSLFADQSGLEVRPWPSYAFAAGYADTTAFTACMRDAITRRQVDADVRAAGEIGVHGTPAILINDILLIGLPAMAELTRQINTAASPPLR